MCVVFTHETPAFVGKKMSMCHITIQVIASLDFAQSCLRSGITYTIDALVSDDWNEWMDYKITSFEVMKTEVWQWERIGGRGVGSSDKESWSQTLSGYIQLRSVPLHGRMYCQVCCRVKFERRKNDAAMPSTLEALPATLLSMAFRQLLRREL